MKRLTVLLIFTYLCACNKSETANPPIVGQWHMTKYIEWHLINGLVVRDTATLGPLDILADFKSDNTVLVQRLNGSSYNIDTQHYVITGNVMYLSKYSNPTLIDTFQIYEFTTTSLSLHLRSNTTNGLPEKWHYWVR